MGYCHHRTRQRTWREIQVMRQVSSGLPSGWLCITLNTGTYRHLEGIKSVWDSQDMGCIEQWCLAHSRAFRRLTQQREQHIQEVKPRDTVFKYWERESRKLQQIALAKARGTEHRFDPHHWRSGLQSFLTLVFRGSNALL